MFCTGFLPEVVVDAEDRVLGKTRGAASRSARAPDSRSRPNGFSTTTRAPVQQPQPARCLTTTGKPARRNRQVVQRPLRVAQRLTQALERARVVVVAET